MQTEPRSGGFAATCDRLSLALARTGAVGAGILFLLSVGDILMGVVARYLFRSSPMWTEELARYTIIWMVMLAANPALRYGEHMKIDLLLKHFPGRLNAVLGWIRRSVFLFIIGFMTYWGILYTDKIAPFTTMGLGISKSVPMAAVPVGMGLLLLQFILMQFVEAVRE